MDLLTTYTHDSKLEAITAPPLIFTSHKSPHNPLNIFQLAMFSPAIPWQWLLAMEILQLHVLKLFLPRLLYRTQPNSANFVSYNISAQTRQKMPCFHCCGPTVPLLRICCLATGTCLSSCCPETSAIYRVSA
jgi:hypothetical protein